MTTAPTSRPRVQFVTYEASRTGSPRLLLRLLRWLRDDGSLDLDLLCWRGGPLLDEFKAVVPTRALAPLGRRTGVETLAVGAGEVGLTALGRRLEAGRLAFALRGRPRADLVYLNGVPSFAALPHLAIAAEVPVLGHVHELEFALGRSLPAEEADLLAIPDRYVAVSNAVADNLVAGHGVDPDDVAVCHGFVDDAPPATVETAAMIRSRLGIPADAAVVGAMGDTIWRKGPDLFVQLAAAVPAAHFVWVGGGPGHGLWDEVTHDVASAGVADRVHLVGEQAHAADWHRLFDVFALTSREDPFPLVLLEAAQVGTPAVAFDRGGAPELLGPPDSPPAGVLVEPLDMAAMAEGVRALLDDADRRRALGQVAAERVADAYVTSVGAPRLLAEIQGLLA